MTQTAAQVHDRRHAWALPDGRHDRTVRLLARLLPMGIGGIVAAMVITPLFPRSEVSFLLDRTRVAVTEDRLSVSAASYRGEDAQGRAFQVTAGNAAQHSARVPVVIMQNIAARLQLAQGSAQVTTASGAYHLDSDHIDAPGAVRLTTTTGMHLQTGGLDIDLKQRRAEGSGGVTGSLDAGTFSADKLVADLDARTVTLEGRARLHMLPARMKHPAGGH